MASPYPVIISAEVHCGTQQQKVLVDILKDVFGDALVSAPLAASNGLQEEALPSPEELKYRIMFKVCSRQVSRITVITDGHVHIPLSPNEPRTNHAGAPPPVCFRYLPQQNRRQSLILIVHVRKGRTSSSLSL